MSETRQETQLENSMHSLLIIILGTYVAISLIGLLSDYLNIAHLSTDIPNEMKDTYDQNDYKKSQEYLIENTKFSFLETSLYLPILLSLLISGSFNKLDLWIESLGFSTIISGIIFIFLLGIIAHIFGLPFDVYKTFKIEKKYGFNKTTIKTFLTDQLKSLLISIIIGVPILYGIIWFFASFTHWGWLFAWGFLMAFQFLMMVLAPIVIMPLFNKFDPLEDGELKQSIEEYAKKEKFKLQGLFKMDGSKRSTKTNAFFTGIGSSKRIVLFDTLIANHTPKELLAVVAHEMGHYKKKHILKMLITSSLLSGIMFYLLNITLHTSIIFEAFGFSNLSVHTGLFIFSFIFAPISFFTQIINARVSRKHEFEADEYAIKTTQLKEAFIKALKTLSKENLSNLTPHPFKVWLEYSHPPVIERINAIRKIS